MYKKKYTMNKFKLTAILFCVIMFFSCDKNNNCVSTPLALNGIKELRNINIFLIKYKKEARANARAS
jgi:hypothetical protein|tara:strand:+ start:161 stop:361 length:201 start_codon:yes stop_codon:yes gene_type:complete